MGVVLDPQRIGFCMGMGRVRLAKTTPIPINIIPTCKQFGKKNLGLSAH